MKLKIFIFILIIFYKLFLGAMEEKQSINYHTADLILKNPLEVLKKCLAEYRRYEEECYYKQIFLLNDEGRSSVKKNYELIQKYQHSEPLFLLNECIGRLCPFSRKNNNQIRSMYQVQVCRLLELQKEKLKKQKQENQTYLTYASFGSGFLFQDLIVLTAFLTQNPEMNMHIHVIDRLYTLYTHFRDAAQDERCVLESTDIDQSILMKRDFQESAEAIIQMHCRFKQFLWWFKHAFAQSYCSLHVFHSDTDYLNHIKNKKIEAPDVLTAIDISASIGTEKEYVYLNHQILMNHNALASNFFISDYKLLKNPIGYSLMLESVSEPCSSLLVVPLCSTLFF